MNGSDDRDPATAENFASPSQPAAPAPAPTAANPDLQPSQVAGSDSNSDSSAADLLRQLTHTNERLDNEVKRIEHAIELNTETLQTQNATNEAMNRRNVALAEEVAWCRAAIAEVNKHVMAHLPPTAAPAVAAGTTAAAPRDPAAH